MKRYLLMIFFLTSVVNAQPTAVCIHGFMATSDSFIPIGKTLECAGLNVYLWDYPSRKETLRGHGHRLAMQLQQIACRFPGEPIHFVSHSVGCLVLRAALNDPACPYEAKIGRIVLIAPPNRGSGFAKQFRGITPVHWIIGNKTGCEIISYDECDIRALGDFPCGAEVLVIAGDRGSKALFSSPNDGYISIEETTLNTPFYRQIFHASHDQLLRFGQIRALIRSFLCRGGSCIPHQ